MATLIASAKLTNAFRVRVVDKNVSAALTNTATLAAVVRRTRRIVSDLESTSSLASTMRYATKGGKGEFTCTSSVVCEFPTYIEIDIEALMLQGLPEGTDCVLNFQEGWQLEDRGRQLPSGAFEYGSNTQNAPSPEFPSFVTFRTPKFFRSAFSSVFSLPSLGNFRLKFFTQVLALQNAFSPVMTANITRRGVTDLQSAFTISKAVIGKLKFFAVQAVSIFEPNEPGGESFLIGNGYEYPPGSAFTFLNPPPPWTFPGFLRIRNAGPYPMPATATLTANVINLPYIFTAHNFSSAFTMSANCDAFKGVGTPHLQSASSMSITTRVDYNSTIPTLACIATIFCRTPVQAQANIVCQSSVTATEGAKLELVWELLTANTTLGLVLKGPSAMSLTVEWIYRAGTAYETAISTETLTSVGAYNPDIADAPVSYFYSKNFGSLDTDEVTVRISGNYNGFQTSKNGVDTVNGEINSDTALSQILYSGNPYVVPGRTRLLRCVSWGNATNLNGAFANCINLNSVPNYIPKNSSVGTMFLNCVQMNDADCISWNTTTLTNFSGMFRGAIRFTQNIGSWNTSNVTNMRNMFNMQEHISGTYGYPVSFPNTNTFNWNVTNVSRDNMAGMFRQHTGANLQLSSWCVSHIATEPVNWTFQTTGSWPTARRPQWGVAC